MYPDGGLHHVTRLSYFGEPQINKILVCRRHVQAKKINLHFILYLGSSLINLAALPSFMGGVST